MFTVSALECILEWISHALVHIILLAGFLLTPSSTKPQMEANFSVLSRFKNISVSSKPKYVAQHIPGEHLNNCADVKFVPKM